MRPEASCTAFISFSLRIISCFWSDFPCLHAGVQGNTLSLLMRVENAASVLHFCRFPTCPHGSYHRDIKSLLLVTIFPAYYSLSAGTVMIIGTCTLSDIRHCKSSISTKSAAEMFPHDGQGLPLWMAQKGTVGPKLQFSRPI